MTKAGHWRAFVCAKKNILQNLHCVAGDAVLIAPFSSNIPCKQGIFQGKCQIGHQSLEERMQTAAAAATPLKMKSENRKFLSDVSRNMIQHHRIF